MLSGLAARNAVKAVSQDGLILATSGSERAASWATIGSVVASMTAIGDGEMFVLALDVDEGNASRLITVAEIEKIWPDLTTMLPVGLPTIVPFEHWGAALVDKPGVVTLYERPGPVITS
jgi:hypothetical protein